MERILYFLCIVTAIQSGFLVSLFGWVLFAIMYVFRIRQFKLSQAVVGLKESVE